MKLLIGLPKYVTDEEIKEVVLKSNGEQSPGPGGFNATFFKSYWGIVGEDVTEAIKEFFSNRKLLKEVNHTFLTLVQKLEGATSFQNYRPISCCNLIYKFISKIIANRLSCVIHHLISPNQMAFIKGEHINEAMLLTHELIRDFSNKMGSSLYHNRPS